MYLTIDNAKEIKAEERAYQAWEREQKNKILAMNNFDKKRTAWKLLFPQVEHSEDWMLQATMF
jgi:hypothetical protein